MSKCTHDQISTGVHFKRVLTDSNMELAYYAADIKIECVQCGQEFEFVGLPCGASPYRPTVSLDGLTMTAPLVEKGGKVPEGLIGYAVNFKNAD